MDNLVYRMGFARTRRGSRQLVNHGHIFVDGKKVDIPSFQVKPGQVIEVRERKKGTYSRYPERNELFTAQPINELLVVEFYNR